MSTKSPLYKIGDVVQLTKYYTATCHEGLAGPMIVLSMCGDTYELLVGDIKIYLYERCLELV